jgi:hypothetical protein
MAQPIKVERSGVVEEGITCTTHVPHRLLRVSAGRGRSQPVGSTRKRLL